MVPARIRLVALTAAVVVAGACGSDGDGDEVGSASSTSAPAASSTTSAPTTSPVVASTTTELPTTTVAIEAPVTAWSSPEAFIEEWNSANDTVLDSIDGAIALPLAIADLIEVPHEETGLTAFAVRVNDGAYVGGLADPKTREVVATALLLDPDNPGEPAAVATYLITISPPSVIEVPKLYGEVGNSDDPAIVRGTEVGGFVYTIAKTGSDTVNDPLLLVSTAWADDPDAVERVAAVGRAVASAAAG